MEKLGKTPKNCIVNNPDLDSSNSDVLYYLIVLNTPLNQLLVTHFLQLTPFIVCGDGGANRFLNALETEKK